jgi:hypothetical protein
MSDTPTLQQILGLWERVLEIDGLSAADNVFSCGASSLQVLRFLKEFSRQFGQRVPIAQIYRNPTPQLLYDGITGHAAISDGVAAVSEMQDEISGEAASAAQRLFYADWKRNSRDPAIYLSVAFEVEGALDLPAFQYSLDAVAARHEALHCYFAMVDGSLVRRFVSDAAVPVRVFPVGEQRESDTRRAALSIVARIIDETIDPEVWPNFRVEIHRPEAALSIIVIVAHHIILDGPGFGNWLDALSRAYADAMRGPLPAASLTCPQQYAYTAWQHRLLAGDARGRLRAEFAEAMSGARFMVPLPLVDTAPTSRGAMHGFMKFTVSRAAGQALAALAVSEGAGAFSAQVAVWNAVLYRLCGATDVVVRVAGSARDHVDFAGIVGVLWTPLFVRSRFEPAAAFGALMATTHQAVLQALRFQHLPIQDAWEVLRPEIDLEREPPNFHFTLHHEQPDQLFALEGLRVRALPSKRIDSGADVKVHLYNHGGGLSGYLVYDMNRVAEETVGRLVADFLRAVEVFTHDPRLSVDAFARLL